MPILRALSRDHDACSDRLSRDPRYSRDQEVPTDLDRLVSASGDRQGQAVQAATFDSRSVPITALFVLALQRHVGLEVEDIDARVTTGQNAQLATTFLCQMSQARIVSSHRACKE
jgi:hypothetical protein